MCLGAALFSAARAARPTAVDFDAGGHFRLHRDDADEDSGSSQSSFAERGSQHARLSITDVEKFEVEQISTSEMLRLRTKGLRLHEVRHRHFNRDPKGPNSVHEEDEEDALEEDEPLDGSKAARPVPDGPTLANAMLEKEAGNQSASEAARRGEGCPEHVLTEWYNRNYAVQDKGNGHAYVVCAGDSESESLKVSCIPKECGGDPWCFVKNHCGRWMNRCRKQAGVSLKCADHDVDAWQAHDNATTTTTTTGLPSEEGKSFLPPLKISPSQMTGYVCVQFDLDLTLLSGGLFPGLFGVGILGDVHYIPTTKCWGWTNELYLQFSLGLEVGGLNFRISGVFIATLMITEQPLDVAKDQLSWELPYNMDTSVCHTKDPFTLIERTFTKQWKHIIMQILASRKTKEEEVRDAVAKFDKENKFEDYVQLLSDSSQHKKWHAMVKPEDAAALGHQTQSMVKTFDGGRIDIAVKWVGTLMTITASPVEASDVCEWMRIEVWQDWEVVTAHQRSAKMLLEKDKEGEWTFKMRGESLVVGVVFLLDGASDIAHQAAFTVGAQQDVSSLRVGVREHAGNRPGTLAIKSVHLQSDGCKHSTDSVRISVLSSKAHWEEATWGPSDLGTGAPWGVGVDLWHPIKDVPNEAAKLINPTVPIVSLDGLLWRDLAALLVVGLRGPSSIKVGEQWSRKWEEFVRKVIDSVWGAPSGDAVDLIHMEVLRAYMLELLYSFKAKLRGGATQDDLDANVEAFVTKLQARLEDYAPKASGESGARLAWQQYRGRSINPDRCEKVGPDMQIASLGMCKDQCRGLRPESCKDMLCGGGERVCNAARFDKEDQMCTLWHCEAWDSFPHMDGYDIAAFLPQDEPQMFVLSPEQILKHLTYEQLQEALSEVGHEEMRVLLNGVGNMLGSNETWSSKVFNVVYPTFPTREAVRSFQAQPVWRHLNSQALRKLLVECLAEDSNWPRVPEVVKLLKAEWGYANNTVVVKLAIKDAGGNSGRKTLSIGERLASSTATWNETIEVDTFDCKVGVTIGWQWQLQPLEGYFKRRKLVSVSQAMFAAYDQFVSKLPAYSQQVSERLTKQPEKWSPLELVAQKLPYKTTDGRYLHRNLKKGEHENLKVHKGDLGTDDAVFNYPKAMEKSRYSETPAFAYNAGLSVANLFLRAVSDVQALFFMYFANHPDWDGKCRSLPAKFHLFHEYPDGDVNSGRSNWETEAADSSLSKLHHPTSKPLRRAGATVREPGHSMSDDETALYRDWHWVSKPHWLDGKGWKRAAFMVKTPPVHGKDGWSTSNVSAMSAVMWPHLWCELVEQSWVAGENDIVAKNLRQLSESAIVEIKELLEPETPQGEPAKFFKMLESVKQRLTGEVFTCPKASVMGEMESLILGHLRRLGQLYGEALTHSQEVMRLFREVVRFLRLDLGEAAETDNEILAKAMQGEMSKLETAAEAIDKIRSIDNDERMKIETIAGAIYHGWELNSRDLLSDPGIVAKHRKDFHDTKRELLLAQAEKGQFLLEVQGHIDRLIDQYPFTGLVKDEFRAAQMRGNDTGAGDNFGVHEEDDEVERPTEERLQEIRKALVYSTRLLSSNTHLQDMIMGEFSLMFSCVDLANRPVPLTPTRFLPWVPLNHMDRSERLQGIMKSVETDEVTSLGGFSGIELIFTKACSLPPDFEFERGAAPELLEDPRHECERVLLSKHLLTILPSFVERVVDTFKALEEDLEELGREPSRPKVWDMIERVRGFVEGLNQSQEMDRDFFTAFAYKSDGSLFGDLWSSLKDSRAKIVATLQERTSGRRNWIKESIQDAALLEKGRRMRVRHPEPPKAEVPAEADGCVCQERWSAWVWYTLPRYRVFRGCAAFPTDGGRLSVPSDLGDTSSWKGVCRTKQRRRSLVDCAKKWAPCDPNVTVDARPEYKIWRRGEVLGDHNAVTLPLVQNDLYMSFDVRSARADFCTPNFAPLLIKHTKQWSTVSWVPWDLRRTNCWGARLHPPGVSALLLRCNHEEPGGEDKAGKSIEWQVVITAYLISYYNTWGTSDGDMTQSWFDGSWGESAAGKGMPGVLTGTSIWSNTGAGFGYMSTGSVMTSPPAFWFAVIAEVLATFSTASLFSKSGNGTKIYATMTAAATLFWRALQRYGVVPLLWGLRVGTGHVAKYLQDITGVTMSPWRNEHDVVLAVQWSYLSRHRVRRSVDLIEDLSAAQMRQAFEDANKYIAISRFWLKHQKQPDASPNDLKHLSRRALVDIVRAWIAEVHFEQHNLDQLFEACPRRPRWYKVSDESQIKVYPCWGKSPEKWLDDRKMPGQELFLMDSGDGWFTEIRKASEEDQYYPADFVSRGALQVYYDTVETAGNEFRQVTPKQFYNILHGASMDDLRCWAKVAKIDQPQALTEVQQSDHFHFWDSRIQQRITTAYAVDFFSDEYTRNFLKDVWRKHVVEDKGLRKNLTRLWFGRGDQSKIMLKPQKALEESVFKRHNWAISLSLMHRLGLPFLKVPALLQVQPYAQLLIAFNVKEILTAIWTRIRGKKKPSMLESHKERVDKCKQCVRSGMAFCDKHAAAQAMLKSGWEESMDECVEKTEANKAACHSFERNMSNAGRMFSSQVCPCFSERSGQSIAPRWITTNGHCKEMRWPDDENENDRRQMKATDWQFGLTGSMGGQKKETLNLNDDLSFEGAPKGCEPGYRCCGSWLQGKEILRCVETAGIKKTNGWFTRAKCKNFKPADVLVDAPWSHVKQEFRCAPRVNSESGFNGTWKVNENGMWEEKVGEENDESLTLRELAEAQQEAEE